MKVLLVHNFYQSSSPSGEDIVFKNEVELLKKKGIKVITYVRHNDEIKDYGLKDRLFLPLRNIWSRKTYVEIKQLIKRERPDIAHFHNIWYLISPSAYDACKDMGIPVVQTLHNFRIFCANGLLLRDGKVCEDCLPSKATDSLVSPYNPTKLLVNAVRYGCYRNSRFYTLPVALMEFWHMIRKTWVEKIDAYITLTEFGRRKFVEAGLSGEKIFVKPNFFPDPPEPNYSHNNYAIFLGRLSQEKGINVLLKAVMHLSHSTHPPFIIKIVGDGPLRIQLESEIRDKGIQNIELTGRKDFRTAIELLKYSKFMIIPSICYESFPMVIMEAFACGKPVVASNLGAMAELVEDGKTGLLFEAGNPYDLAQKIKWMIEHEEECIQMGKNARKIFEEKYTAERNFKILMDIYNKALQRCQVDYNTNHA